MAELLINGQDAATLGIRMGIGFIDALDSPLEIKERIVSESRLEDGAHIVPTPVRFKSRSLSLEFILMGAGSTLIARQKSFKERKEAFLKLLYESAPLRLQVPSIGGEVYKLYYSAKTPSYASNTLHTMAKITVKFDEPNPLDRA